MTFIPNTLCGILKFSSRKSGVSKRKGYVTRSFRDITGTHPEFYVETKKISERRDMYVVVNVTNNTNITNNTKLTGTISRYIGYVDESDINDILPILATAHWKKKVNKVKYDINEPILNDRIDCRDMFTVTYDNATTCDYDDALSLNITDNHYTLCIHISEPTSYVEYGSKLDAEITSRCETVYIEPTNHMLPETIMNRFSLTNGFDREALTLFIEFEKNNDEYILSQQYFKSTLINVNENRSYVYERTTEYDNIMHDLAQHINSYENMEHDVIDNETMIHTFMRYYNCVASNTISDSVHYDTTNGINVSMNTEQSYCTFTSPLRKHRDMVSQRQLLDVINSNDVDYSTMFDKQTIAKINYYHKYYATLTYVKAMHTVYVENYSDSGEFIVDGRIISFINDKAIVSLNAEGFMDNTVVVNVVDSIIFDRDNLMEINENSIKVSGLNSMTSNELEYDDITLNIGDVVNVKIIPIHNRKTNPTKFFHFTIHFG